MILLQRVSLIVSEARKGKELGKLERLLVRK